MVQHNLARFNANLIRYEFCSISEDNKHGGIQKITTDSLTNNFVFLITIALFYTVHQCFWITGFPNVLTVHTSLTSCQIYSHGLISAGYNCITVNQP